MCGYYTFSPRLTDRSDADDSWLEIYYCSIVLSYKMFYCNHFYRIVLIFELLYSDAVPFMPGSQIYTSSDEVIRFSWRRLNVVWATTIQITHPWDSAMLREHLATMCYTTTFIRGIFINKLMELSNNCTLVYILHLEVTYVSVPHQSGSVSSARSLIALRRVLRG